MSSIRKRNGKYQAQVRINGASVTRSFRTKSEASSWSRHQEARLETRKANALKHGFQRLRKRAGLEHIRFHDLRHEAVSRLFEKGLPPPEVASVSGHRTLSQLMRYSHADLNAVSDKMKKADEAKSLQLGPVRLE